MPLDASRYLHYAVDITPGDEGRLGGDWPVRVQEVAAMGLWDQAIPDDRLTWSGQTCSIFGLAADSPPADFEAFLAMVHPDDRETIVRKTARAVAADEEPYRVVYRITRQDTDEERIVHEEARVERREDGSALRMVGVIHDITEAQKERDELTRKGRAAEKELAELRGLIPICSRCKSIRDDKGLWTRVEEHFSSREDIDFSHGLCPGCSANLYPSAADDEGKEG